jgi:hypothetical protein
MRFAMNSLQALFTAHPASVNESYLQHMRMSGTFGLWLLLAAACAFVHALLPFMVEKTASGIIRRLYGRMVSHRAVRPATSQQSARPARDLAFDSACL